MRRLITLALVGMAISAHAQKADTIKTSITLTPKQLITFQSIEKEKKKIDSLFQIRINTILDFVLDANGIDIKDLVGVEPKENGVLVIKTLKK